MLEWNRLAASDGKKDHFANAVMVAQWGLHFTYFTSGGERARGSVLF